MEGKGPGLGEPPPPHYPYAPFPAMHPFRRTTPKEQGKSMEQQHITPNLPQPLLPGCPPLPNVAPWVASIPILGCWYVTVEPAPSEFEPFVTSPHVMYEVPTHFVAWVKYLEVLLADALCDTLRCEIWSAAARVAIETSPYDQLPYPLTCLPTGFHNLNMQVTGGSKIYVRLTNTMPASRRVKVVIWGWKAEESVWDVQLGGYPNGQVG